MTACFVVMDRTDYNEEMKTLLSDHQSYQLVHKPPFAKIEREIYFTSCWILLRKARMMILRLQTTIYWRYSTRHTRLNQTS